MVPNYFQINNSMNIPWNILKIYLPKMEKGNFSYIHLKKIGFSRNVSYGYSSRDSSSCIENGYGLVRFILAPCKLSFALSAIFAGHWAHSLRPIQQKIVPFDNSAFSFSSFFVLLNSFAAFLFGLFLCLHRLWRLGMRLDGMYTCGREDSSV